MKYFKLFIKEQKMKALITFFLLLGQVVGTLLIPALIADIVDKGIMKGDMGVIKVIGFWMLVVAFVSMLFSVLGSWTTGDLASLFGKQMRSKLFDKVSELSVEQFNGFGVSSLVTRSTSDITMLQQTFGMIVQMVVPAPLMIGVSMVMTFMISPIIALLQLLFMGILLVCSMILLKKSNGLSHSIQIRLDRINKVLRENITGVRIIRAFGNEEYEEKRSEKVYSDYADNMIRLNRLFAIFTPFIWLLMGCLMTVILGLGGLFSLKGFMAVGQIAAVTEYAMITIFYLMMAVATLTMIPKASACLERLEEVLDTKVLVKDYDFSPLIRPFCNKSPLVEFRKVGFSYKGASESVINDLSFSIKSGETVAIIGSTGSGKSTISDLVLRLHDVSSGFIKFLGVDIREIPQETLRKRVMAVPQKAFLFSGTIEDNLRMGNVDASEDELWYALETAQARDFVENLPDRMGFFVSQGGTNFSGGQRQRLAIARALVGNPDLLVFDDSFSALDVRTDAKLRKALCHGFPKVAKLIIAQRVSSIMDADQILVLDEGCLVGFGSHEYLMDSCDVYRDIAKSQLSERGN